MNCNSRMGLCSHTDPNLTLALTLTLILTHSTYIQAAG